MPASYLVDVVVKVPDMLFCRVALALQAASGGQAPLASFGLPLPDELKEGFEFLFAFYLLKYGAKLRRIPHGKMKITNYRIAHGDLQICVDNWQFLKLNP